MSQGTSDAPLDSSGNTSQVSGSDTTTQRINDLMSKWQSEQAAHEKTKGELTRLQGLLTETVADHQEVRTRLASLEATQGTQTQETAQQLTTAEARVAELTSELAERTAHATRLQYLVDHPDLAPYAAILPATTSLAELDSAAGTIRSARKQETGEVRDHLGIPRGGGGGASRFYSGAKPSANEIKTYLSAATTSDDFERRLKEVSALPA
jgi:vacuolar-type H+-ATPase subunit I/STV1